MKYKHSEYIDAPIEKVYQELIDIERWPELIPHVNSITPIKIDDKQQHIVMTVLNGDKQETIETIRYFKENEYIEFHQISMNTLLKKHDGLWVLKKSGKGTIVDSIHDIEMNNPIINLIGSIFTWKYFIKKNSMLTLRAVKLKLEYKNNKERIVEKSCFVSHSIDVNLPIKEVLDTVGNPGFWPALFPTAIDSKIIKENDELCEFKLVEYVGKKKFNSHIYLHKDQEQAKLYYEHFPPSFPLKYMVIRWIFEEIDERNTRFIILREYDINIPIIGRALAHTLAKKVINSHVRDYHCDLKKFERNLNIIKWYNQYQKEGIQTDGEKQSSCNGYWNCFGSRTKC